MLMNHLQITAVDLVDEGAGREGWRGGGSLLMYKLKTNPESQKPKKTRMASVLYQIGCNLVKKF